MGALPPGTEHTASRCKTGAWSLSPTPHADSHCLTQSCETPTLPGAGGFHLALRQGEPGNRETPLPDARCSRSFWLTAAFSASATVPFRKGFFLPAPLQAAPAASRAERRGSFMRRGPGGPCRGSLPEPPTPAPHTPRASLTPARAWRPALNPGPGRQPVAQLARRANPPGPSSSPPGSGPG